MRDGVVVMVVDDQEEDFTVADKATDAAGVAAKKTAAGLKPNRVWVRHADGSVADYVHLKRGGCAVKVGDAVRQGQRLGVTGMSGITAGEHLHVQVDVHRGFDAAGKMRTERVPIAESFQLHSGAAIDLIKEHEDYPVPKPRP